MRAAPFFPGQTMSTAYAMAGDDASLHFDMASLTPKQQADHQSNVDLTGFLQVALIGLGKPADYVMMYDLFRAAPWPDRLAAYTGFFERMGLAPVPPAHRQFHPPHGFYDSVARSLPPTNTITLYMTSGTNSVLHRDAAAYAVSRNVNSKVHFAENAPGFGIPVPETLVITKGDLDGAPVRDFFTRHHHEIMLKTLGLAGARNVTAVDSLQACHDYVAEYPDDMAVILQQKLDLSRYTEMTVDLVVTDTDVRISNVRQLLFADGLWVGNLIGPDVPLTPDHEQALLKVGAYARAQGHTAPEGFNCGVDYFIADDGGSNDSPGEFIVTEINARWTGGLFPAEMIRRVEAEQETCVAFIDLVSAEKFDAYLNFVDRYLYKTGAAPFAMIPLGFSPVPQQMPDGDAYYTWQVVAGDFEAFKQARRAELGDGALMTAEAIQFSL